MSYQRALGQQDYKTARSFMSDDFSFKGPLATHDKPEGLLKDLEQLHNIVKGVEMKKVFVDGDDVCLLYDLITSSPPMTSFTCELYHVEDGKIRSIRTVFDARPFAAMFEKRSEQK
ncbi:MAG: nuclear transport factor 2 family protein, partial [Thaumarchaeota archaeon]|nr:nuclear transport factor 2 family protein [Nitrososphaerota archaeon]